MIPTYLVFFVFLFGLTWGSFLNVCIFRIPRGESIVYPPSHCTGCGQAIRWYDNIPLLSWVVLHGKCRQCKETISFIYPLVEFLAGLLTLQTVIQFGLTWESLALICLGYAFIVLVFIDLYHYILPDVITLPGVVLGLLLAGSQLLGSPLANIHDAAIGVAAGGGGLWAFAWIFEKITGKVGMGFGDVKLLAMIGAWFGWQALPFTLFFAALVGSLIGIIWIAIIGRDRSFPIPFGPYLAGAAWLYLFVGQRVYHWYWGYFIVVPQ